MKRRTLLSRVRIAALTLATWSTITCLAPVLCAADSAGEAVAIASVPKLTLTLCSEISYDNERTPVDPGDDFRAFATSLYVAVVAEPPADVDCTVRIVVENIEGLAPGTEVVSPEQVAGDSVRTETPRVVIACPLPRTGLRPGRYRLEVLRADETRAVLARASFTTHYPTLPPATALTLTFGTTEGESDTLADAASEFSSATRLLLARVALNEGQDATLHCALRIVADEVATLAHDRLIVVTTPDFEAALSPETRSVRFPLPLPRIGLPPGRYRAELFEKDPPQRVVLTTTFTARPLAEETAPLNLADAELGGAIERVSGEDGVGVTCAPALLQAGNAEVWEPYSVEGPGEGGSAREATPSPCELVLSFFQREPARVASVEIDAESPDGAPRELEIWGSMQSVTEGFTLLSRQLFETPVAKLAVPLDSPEVRFLKLRVVSRQSEAPLHLLAIRAFEGTATGYVSLLKRRPELADWKLQPRHAAQRGLHFLQPDAVRWQKANRCLGCHVQSQAVMGISVGRANDYVVSSAVERYLTDYTRERQVDAGDFARAPGEEASGEVTLGTFAALTLAYAQRSPERDAALARAAQWLVTRQLDDGSVPGDNGRAPIEQGDIQQAGNAIEIWTAALAIRPETSWSEARAKALAFVAAAETHTTQDRAFKILTLAQRGDAAQQKAARQLAVQLADEARNDGSWRIEPEDPEAPASPFATGQALYAMRQAGLGTNTRAFRRGVEFLMSTQGGNGAWSDPALTSSFAATMWPVIALAGSFRTQPEPARLIVTAAPRPRPPAPAKTPPVPVVVAAPVAPSLPANIVIVFDCSLSMLDRLEGATRLKVAKQVLHGVIAKLPDDARVGLRLYGHRHDSMSPQSRTDTQLVVPVGPLDRAALNRVIDGAAAHGQTPLVYSTLQAAEDLRPLGGGAIIVVTDGEESCGGKPRKAGQQIAAAGVPLRLDVIGFTIAGKRVVEDLTAFTRPSGGRFYGAADGAQLSRALAEAISPAPRDPPPPPPAATVEESPAPEAPEDFPYEVFDATGVCVARASTLGAEMPELAPGVYRVVLRDGAKTATLDGLKLAPGDALELRYLPEEGVLRREK